MTPALLDHLWQSTLFAGGAWLLTLWLRRNPARLRFRLWFAASLKFLIPFAALSALGESLSRLFPTTVPPLVLAIGPAAERFSAPAHLLAQHRPVAGFDLVPVLAVLWFAGFASVLAVQATRWLRLRAVMRQARDARIAAPLNVKASTSLLEPGLVGILNPVVLMPEGLMARLSTAERDAILAHELSHFSSGDNITAAIHMLVEALFWFYPPVWLIGSRLIVERERACDESVLADGHDAEVYAQGILKVCRFCVQSPLACAPGASGADLDRRVRQIMSGESATKLNHSQKAMLAAAMAVALGLPVAEGFVSTPPLVVEVRQRVAAVKFQVAARLAQAATQVQQQITVASVTPVLARHLSRLKIVPPLQEGAPQEQRASEAVPLRLTASAPTVDAPVATPAPPPQEPSSPEQRMTVAEAAPVGRPAPPVALYPQGDGDPDSVTCRLPEALPGSRLPGPRVCQTNRQWASLRARHEDITPDGKSIILGDAAQMHTGAAVFNCSPARVMGPSISSNIGLPMNFCF